MPRSEAAALGDWLDDTAETGGHLWARDASVALDAFAHGCVLGDDLPRLQDRSVLLATDDQLTTALALIELDGVARRLTLLPPDLPPAQLLGVLADAAIDSVVLGPEARNSYDFGVALRVTCRPLVAPAAKARFKRRETEWALLTSGTTSLPKMVSHSLSGLIGAIKRTGDHDGSIVWATFYDIRRYGGLQIFLRAILGGSSLVLSDPKEPVGDFLVRLGKHGVTHLSGTPSHWRQALMSPSARAISPRYVRLSGEIADQAILDHLAAFYPQARIGHAYASTEAGVGFEVNDGREGFPADLIGRPGEVEMKVIDGTLRIRSRRTALGYVGCSAVLADENGFVDTGDVLERRCDRYYFVGRRDGIINIGGLKVHPEEVEAIINQHPAVRMSLVHPRKSPITGAIVVADVVLGEEAVGADSRNEILQREIAELCRARLAKHKVPAMIRFVPTLSVAASGKLERLPDHVKAD